MSPKIRLIVVVPVLAVVLGFAGSAEARRRSVIHRPPTVDPAYSQGGYADRASVVQGSSIRLHIATSVSPFTMQIINLADPTTPLMTRSLTSRAQDCSGRFSTGCGWDVTTTLDIPMSWRSGYYAAAFPTASGTRYAPFIVRAANPGSRSRFAIVASTNTWQAYNGFGGRSFYSERPHIPGSPVRATEVSFDRPYDQEAGLGRYPIWEAHFVRWLTEENRPYEVLADSDLENPASLSGYEAVVLVGHSEYWTSAARATLETFSRQGGHIAIFGGNTMWWQVRLVNNTRSMVGFKERATFDPNFGTANDTVTTNWYAYPVENPENRIIGPSFRNGGYANKVDTPNDFSIKPVEQRIPWTVTDSSHWVFAGTGLVTGMTFGREIAGLEVDGVLFNCDTTGQIIGAEGSDESPRNYHILATIPASDGWGTMGFYVNSAGGAVFNAATQGWAWGLESRTPIRIMTANILDRFSVGAPFPYDPDQDGILAEDRFNCSNLPNVTAPGWRGSGDQRAITQSCAYEGPGGLELAGTKSIAMSRSFAPAGSARDHVDIRFYLKVDELQQRTQYPMPLVLVRNRTDRRTEQLALVEVDASGATKQVRVARRGPDGFVPAPTWIPLENGWHLIELTWRSPGLIELQVDGSKSHSVQNPHNQRANEMVIELPATEPGRGTGRVCIDAIAAGAQKLGRLPELR